MRCRRTLERERERLERALKATRNEMASIIAGGTPMKLWLDEAKLQGQIQSIDYALATEDGGWPHDAWIQFLDARRDAISSMLKAGHSYSEILATLNLTEVQARLIVKMDETTTSN